MIDEDISDIQINKMINEMREISRELKFISMSRTKENTSINFDLKPKSFENLTALTDTIKKRFSNSKVILSYNNDLAI